MKKLATLWPNCTHDISCHNSLRIRLKRGGTNGPWNWRFTIPKSQNDVGQTVSDQWSSWLCCFCMWPLPSVYKSSCLTDCQGREGSQPLDRRPPPSLPASPLPPVANTWNKANSPPTWPVFWLLSGEQLDPRYTLSVTLVVQILMTWGEILHFAPISQKVKKTNAVVFHFQERRQYYRDRLGSFAQVLVSDKQAGIICSRPCIWQMSPWAENPPETKNDCVHVQLEQIMDKIKRDLKPNFWRAGSKCRVYAWPLHSTPLKGWANHLSNSSCLTPGQTPTVTPCKEPACLPWVSKWASEPVACSHFPHTIL